MITIIKNILLIFLLNILLLSKSYSIETKATSAYVMDATSNKALYEKNSNLRYGPASMSKLMIIYMTFERLQNGSLKLDDELLVSRKAWKFGGSKMFVNIGDKVSVNDLLKGVIIQSGNDACIVLAEGLSGSEENMVDAINEKAKELGLLNSNFANVTGWPDKDHYMTARDIAHLSKLIIEVFPEYYYYFSLKSFTYNNIEQFNRNELINLEGYDGLKTGRTTQAGFGLVVSKVKGDQRIISVVNGLNSNKERVNETKKMVNWSFREFKNFHLFDNEDTVLNGKVWLGNKSTVPLITNENLYVTIRKSNIDKFQVKAVYNSPIEAPIKKGQKIGELIIFDGDEDIIKPLFAAQEINTISRFSRSFSIINYILFGVSSPK